MIKKGELTLDKIMTVRPETWARWHGPAAGSTMFLSAGEQVNVDNLLKGIVTLSGNDACVVLAEGISGTEEAFAARMNEAAKRLGLTNSNFGNSNGWPDEAAAWAAPEALVRRAEFAWWQAGLAAAAGSTNARALAELALGPLARAETVTAISRAGSQREALTLLLASPEFQRR